jgi:hypothetical protein
MDGEYLWVILLVLYLIFQVLGGRKKKKTTKRPDVTGQPRPDAPEARRPETLMQTRSRDAELDDALHEIRRALGFPDEGDQPHERVPEVEAHPETPPVTRREPHEPQPLSVDSERPQQRPTTPTVSRERPVSIPKATVVARRGIGGSSTEFQSDQEQFPGRLRKPSPALKPIKDIRGIQAAQPATKGLKDIRKRLNSPQSLRESFLIKEVLDQPRSKRPMR